MADFNSRIPGCDDDGEGERGERGERGKRGQRGHRGHDGHDGHDGKDGDTGSTGPAGPTEDELFRVPYLQVTGLNGVNDICRARGMIFGPNIKSSEEFGTTISAASNNVSLPTGTINVASTAAPANAGAAFPPTGQLTLVTTTGEQLVNYTGTTPTSFTGVTGGSGVMGAGQTVSIATTIAVPAAFPTGTINVVSTAGFPAANVATVIAPGSNGEILPQGAIEVASTVGFPTAGILRITLATGAVHFVAYTGTTPTSFTGVTGGTGVLTTGDAVAAAAELLVETSTGEQLVTYTGTTPTSFTGVEGWVGAGTLSIGGIVTPARTDLYYISGTWVLNTGKPAGQIVLPGDLPGIQYDTAFSMILVNSSGVPFAAHGHNMSNWVATGLTIVPNTAIFPALDNSSLTITGTAVLHRSLTDEAVNVTIVLARPTKSGTFTMTLTKGFHVRTPASGVIIESASC